MASKARQTSAEVIEDGVESYLVSIAYPPRAHDDKTPLQMPIAMGSAV